MRSEIITERKTTDDVSLTISHNLKPADQTILYRMVGFSEYTQAIEMLSELVRISSPAEIKVYNKIISGKPELDVYSNLSRLVETDSQLSERSLNKDQDFKQSGLDWMLALAKVEIGAMLASYSPVPEPFAVFPPTTFDQHAFAELLLDGARSHYWSLTKDPMLVQVIAHSEKPTSETVAYVRRLKLSMAFLRAAIGVRGQNWNSQEFATAQKWYGDLDQLKSQLDRQIQKYLSQSATIQLPTRHGSVEEITPTSYECNIKTDSYQMQSNGESCRQMINVIQKTGVIPTPIGLNPSN